MNLQKKLIQLSEYKCSFKYVDSYFLVSVTYPENWSVIPSEDRTIEVAEEDGVTFYAAPIETNIDNAFTLIDDTIAYNLDVEKKMALLKYNIGKLQEIFAEKDLEELETIEFVFKPKNKPTVRKTTKRTTNRKKDEKGATNKEKKVDTNKNCKNLQPLWVPLEDSVAEPNLLEENADINAVENKYLEEIER